MSSGNAQPVPDGEAWSRSVAVPEVSLLVGRVLGTVVVTVDGALSREGSELLAGVLSDLIEGQGNLAVAVHLGKAIVDPEAVTVFAEAAKRASERGAKFILEKPPIETHEALRAGDMRTSSRSFRARKQRVASRRAAATWLRLPSPTGPGQRVAGLRRGGPSRRLVLPAPACLAARSGTLVRSSQIRADRRLEV